tara:strand:+ start:1266 stop:1952 length:687 start_codon:yes stop_codon:yes gene_type:complete
MNAPQVIPLFSTPLFIHEQEVTSVDFEFIKNTKQIDINYSESHFKNGAGSTSEGSYLLNHSEMSSLKDKILNSVKEYAHGVMQVGEEVEFYITRSWSTIHKEGDYAFPHSHANSLLSGVMYINVPKDDESLVEFMAPSNHTLFPLLQPRLKEHNIWNHRIFSFKPETGNIIIFPSNLVHSTTPMTSSTSLRYIVGFDIFVRGEFKINDAHLDGPVSESLYFREHIIIS